MTAVAVRLGYRPMGESSQLGSDLDALLRRVADGDVGAFTAFYDRTRARVFGLVLRVVRDRGYSEETTQEVYLQVWRGAAGFDPSSGSALAWLLTVAHRRAVDRVRAEHASAQRESRYGASNVAPDADVVADAAMQHDEQRHVVECLESLTNVQREAIQLAYYRGLTYREVSETLTVNLSTVKARMREGLRRLRDCLGMT